jgi:hypothetical protein
VENIDYKQLLEKYMQVVYFAEGCTYLSFAEEATRPKSDEKVGLTQEEIDELDRISEELGLG